jgi:hypothetical protein
MAQTRRIWKAAREDAANKSAEVFRPTIVSGREEILATARLAGLNVAFSEV